MFWKYGLFCSIFAGSIWGAFWQIIFTMMGILTFGIPLELDVNQMLGMPVRPTCNSSSRVSGDY